VLFGSSQASDSKASTDFGVLLCAWLDCADSACAKKYSRCALGGVAAGLQLWACNPSSMQRVNVKTCLVAEPLRRRVLTALECCLQQQPVIFANQTVEKAASSQLGLLFGYKSRTVVTITSAERSSTYLPNLQQQPISLVCENKAVPE
jgi:hypothetical protein